MSPEMILTSPPLSKVAWHYLSQAILQPQLCQKKSSCPYRQPAQSAEISRNSL